MGDGSGLPSTLNYGQTIEWIACSIGHLASREYMVHEMHHLDSNDFGVEPALNLVATRLGWADLDDTFRREPTMSVAQAVWQAQKQLYDALCAGRVTMTGHPNWEPANVIRAVPQMECTNLRFREDGNGLITAAVKMNLRMFWSVIRFSSAEIEKEWPVLSMMIAEQQEEAVSDESKASEFLGEHSFAIVALPTARRKRGPRGDLGKSIRQAMRDAVGQGYDLEGALEKELPINFGGKRTSCRAARNDVLAEIVAAKLRQTAGNDK